MCTQISRTDTCLQGAPGSILWINPSRKVCSILCSHHHGRANCSASREGSRVSRAAYREWRTVTFGILFPGKGDNIEPIDLLDYMEVEIDKRVKRLKATTFRSLRAYVDDTIPREEKREAKEHLGDIIRNAIHLDLDMKKYDADFSLSFEGKEVSNFDPARMEEAVQMVGEGMVGLIVSPPLYKETDSASGICQRRLLKKAEVCSGNISRVPQSVVQKAISSVYTLESRPPTNHSSNHKQRYQERGPAAERLLSSHSSRSSKIISEQKQHTPRRR